MRAKLSVGDTFEQVFGLYRDHAGVLLPLAFWLYLAVAIADGIVGNNLAYFPIVLIVSTIVGTLYQGTVVGLVRGVQEDRDNSSMGDLVSTALPFLPRLIAVGVLSAIAIAIGFLLLIVPGFYLMTIWAVLAPVIVVERCGVFDSFGRSRDLVSGNGWPVLGALVVAFVIAAIGALVLTSLAEAIAGGPILRIVFSAIASTATAPIAALVASVLYYRLLAIERAAAPPPPPASAVE